MFMAAVPHAGVFVKLSVRALFDTYERSVLPMSDGVLLISFEDEDTGEERAAITSDGSLTATIYEEIIDVGDGLIAALIQTGSAEAYRIDGETLEVTTALA